MKTEKIEFFIEAKEHPKGQWLEYQRPEDSLEKAKDRISRCLADNKKYEWDRELRILQRVTTTVDTLIG